MNTGERYLQLGPEPAAEIGTAIAGLNDTVDALARDEDWPEDWAFRVKLALEEVVINALSYGNPNGATTPEVRVRLIWSREGIAAEVQDNGVRFDPLDGAPPPDVPEGEGMLPEHGLGIMLARQFMDTMEYRYEQQRNHLRMTLAAPVAAGN